MKVEKRSEIDGNITHVELTLELISDIANYADMTNEEVMQSLREGERIYTMVYSYKLLPGINE